MEKILSVIVPSYNTANFIEENVTSIICEEVMNDLEIIIVNDGSKDDTLEKAKQIEKHYPSVVKVINKNNGGHGSTINEGVIVAKGKYFKVIDGDDHVEREGLIRLIDLLRNIESDIVVSPFYTYSVVTHEKKLIMPNDYSFIVSGNRIIYDKELYVIDCINDIYGSIHAITYKTAFYKSCKIKLSEKTFFEDNEYVLFPIKNANTVYISDVPVYVYLIDQINQSISKSNAFKRVDQLEQIVFNLSTFFAKNLNMDKEKKEYIKRAIVNQINVVFSIYQSQKKKLIKLRKRMIQFDRRIKEIDDSLFYDAGKKRLVKFCRLFNYFGYFLCCLKPNRKGKRY